MTLSLYQISVPGYLQTLDAVHGFLQRGLDHCHERGIDAQEIVETRLYPDMLPFRFQIQSVVHHSIGAMHGIRDGLFHPPGKGPQCNYSDLLAMVFDASASLRKLTPEEVNSHEGAAVMFELSNNRLPFTAEDFVLSFSLPNFHFHATTAYDILRSKGVPLGKRDYLGRLRLDK